MAANTNRWLGHVKQDIAVVREVRNRWHRNKRLERKAQGLCSCCGKPPIPGKTYCEQRRRWNAVNTKHLSAEEKQKAYALFDSWDGICQCCGNPHIGKRNPHLDHKDGKVRGLICNYCNVALGYLRDNPEIAERAAAYLRRTNGQ